MASMQKNLLVTTAVTLLLLGAPMCQAWASQAEELEQLKQDITVLGNLAERTRLKIDRVLEIETKILKSRARETASLWRETGLHDGDMQTFNDFRNKFNFIQKYTKQDFSKIHGQFSILQRQIAAMETVSFGKKDKLEITETTLHGDAFYHKALQKFGFFKSKRSISDQMNVDSQRNDLMDALVAVYLNALAADSPKQGQEIMKSYAGILQTLGDVNRDIILEQVDKLRLQEEKMMLDMIPIFGDAMAVAEAYQGQDIWGKKLSWVDYGLAMISVISVVGDSAGIVRLAKNYPKEAVQLAESLSKARMAARNMSKKELILLAAMYPPQQLEKLFDANMASLMARAKNITKTVADTPKKILLTAAHGLPEIRLKPNQSIDDIGDAINIRGMALARQSIAEEQRAKDLIAGLSAKDKATAIANAEKAIEDAAPAIDMSKLANPDTMTDADWKAFQSSLDIDDGTIKRLQGNPTAMREFIERETGIPIDVLNVKAGAISSNEYVAYRKANHESLRLQKRAIDDDFAGVVTKHKDIKGKSGPGGIIPVDQAFSKMSKELEVAEAAGDVEKIAEIEEKIRKSNHGVEDIIERGIARRSSTLEGREVIAVRRNVDGVMQRSLVTRDPNTGQLFDLEHARVLGDGDNVTILKNASGGDLKVDILVDNNGRVYVADADPHIIGVRGGDELVDDTRVNGFATRSEEMIRHNQNIALRQSGNISYTQHGAQVRAYGLDLPVDETFYVIENGKLRFLKQKNLPDLVHHHRLNGRNAPVDPTWEWGTYNPGKGFVRETQ